MLSPSGIALRAGVVGPKSITVVVSDSVTLVDPMSSANSVRETLVTAIETEPLVESTTVPCRITMVMGPARRW
jgi:hypothetical protein